MLRGKKCCCSFVEKFFYSFSREKVKIEKKANRNEIFYLIPEMEN
jgi:hypothetical protein